MLIFKAVYYKKKMKQLFATLFVGRNWSMLVVDDLKKDLLSMSRGDKDLVVHRLRHLDSLSLFWQKCVYFIGCSASGNELLFNHSFYHRGPNIQQARNRLIEGFRSWQMKNMPLCNHYLIYNDFTGWQKQVVDWYNNKVALGCEASTTQLYLWDATGLGKTRLFNHLFGKYFSVDLKINFPRLNFLSFVYK